MNIGEIISALVLCASSWDDDKDRLLLLKNVYDIEVHDGYIEIYFTDGNTEDVRIYPDGRAEPLN